MMKLNQISESSIKVLLTGRDSQEERIRKNIFSTLVGIMVALGISDINPYQYSHVGGDHTPNLTDAIKMSRKEAWIIIDDFKDTKGSSPLMKVSALLHSGNFENLSSENTPENNELVKMLEEIMEIAGKRSSDDQERFLSEISKITELLKKAGKTERIKELHSFASKVMRQSYKKQVAEHGFDIGQVESGDAIPDWEIRIRENTSDSVEQMSFTLPAVNFEPEIMLRRGANFEMCRKGYKRYLKYCINAEVMHDSDGSERKMTKEERENILAFLKKINQNDRENHMKKIRSLEHYEAMMRRALSSTSSSMTVISDAGRKIE